MDKMNPLARDNCLCLCAFDMSRWQETGAEFTMPEYYPVIRRVVSVSAKALPDSKFLTDKTAEVGGTIAFRLLYIGEDGALTCAPYECEFTQSFPIEDCDGIAVADIRTECCAESVTARPTGPRTVFLKAKLRCRIFADKKEGVELKPLGEGKDPAPTAVIRTLERLERDMPTVYRKSVSATGTLSAEETLSEEAKPVSLSGEILIDSCTAGKDSITVKGNALVSCLVITKSGTYKTLDKLIPFEERIAAEGCTPKSPCAAFGRVASVSAAPNGDTVLCEDCEYDLEAVFATVFDAAYTEDVYSTEYELSKKSAPVKAQTLSLLENVHFSQSAESKRKTESKEGEYIISTAVEAKLDRIEQSEDKLSLFGNCTFKVYIASEGDVCSEELCVPTSVDCTALCPRPKDGELKLISQISAGPVDCSLDKNTVHLSCRLCAYLEAVCDQAAEPIVEVVAKAKDRSAPDGTVLRIVYPQKGLRIWDVAKEWRTPLCECERNNGVSRCDLSDGTPLIIK